MNLKKYQEKRTFKTTDEPKGKIEKADVSHLPIFCVQKHDASHLHYDFRLEHKGVLLSWAVPKGPSFNSHEKRLAIQVEDHPFDYRNFEGVIAKGNYGAGTVMLWDEGTYSTKNANTKKEIEKAIDAGLKKGHLEFFLNGDKLLGTFNLIKIKSSENQWLMIKGKDEYEREADLEKLDISVKSKKSLDQIAGGISIKKKKPAKKLPTKKLPLFFRPMLTTLHKEAFDDPDWIFEIKWDGYRALAYVDNHKVQLYSRNENSFNALFHPIVKELEKVSIQCILDGEVVLLDESGKSDFQLMQNYQNTGKGNLYYYVFDLLWLDGEDLRELPLMERKEKLEALLKAHAFEMVRYSDHIDTKGIFLYKKCRKLKLEGIIAKKKSSTYSSLRSKQWLKIKAINAQEFVICGFTAPRASRKHFGALLLGFYENKKLKYAGHVGTGFSQKSLQDLFEKMSPLIVDECPFVTKLKTNMPATWIKPILVGEVAFTEWTNENILRHPTFLGLRLDKRAKEVKRENPK